MKTLDYLVDVHAKASDEEAWRALPAETRMVVATQLRDAYFEGMERALTKSEKRAFLKATRVMEPQLEVEIAGLSVCPHPSRTHRLARFVELEGLEPELRAHFARPCEKMPHLSAVFADPRDFTYRNFENIVSLDRLSESVDMEFEVGEASEPIDGVLTMNLGANDETTAYLGGLDALELYVRPLETNSRGGKRFIFHDSWLADALTWAMKQSLPEPMREGLVHVNPVFRCNRFEPGDDPFDAHLDAPYYDPNRGHVSKYTLILYLTGGASEGTLSFGERSLDAIEPMTAVLFDQRLEHSGAPFDAGDKVFVRTELIYEIGEEEHEYDPGISALFSTACYMDRQSLFHEELSEYMEECYAKVARAHWEGLDTRGKKAAAAYLHKEFRGVHFLSNGHDYWFRDDVDLRECAAMATLDMLNHGFERQCTSEVVRAPDHETGWILDFMKGLKKTKGPGLEPFPKERLTPEWDRRIGAGGIYYATTLWESGDELEPVDVSHGQALGDSDVRKAYEAARAVCKSRIDPAPVIVLGGDFYLDRERILVDGDSIYIQSDTKPEPIHFAADVTNVQQCYAGHFIRPNALVETPYLSIPPIRWRRVGRCFHLTLDMFLNGWMLTSEQRSIWTPRIHGRPNSRRRQLDQYSLPWYDAVHGLTREEDETVRELHRGPRQGDYW